MPLPLIPIVPALIIGGSGLFAGTFLARDNNDANVVVNTTPQNSNLKTALYVGAAGIALIYGPRLLSSKK